MFRTEEHPLRLVSPHPGGNVRQRYDAKELDKLEASIKAVGLLHPPGVVEDGKGGYWLIFGWRRVEVLKRLFGLDNPVRLTICPADIDREVLGLVENVQRQDLEPWELADQLHTMVHVRELSTNEVAELVKLSPGHVGNLVRLRKQLCPELWATFRKLGASANMTHFLRLCALPQTHQVAQWNADLERGATDDQHHRTSAHAHARKLLDTMPEPRGDGAAYWRGFRRALVAVIERKSWEDLGHAAKKAARRRARH